MAIVSVRTGRQLAPDYTMIDKSTGMQRDYPVLSDDECAERGLKEPIQTLYLHRKCKKETTMPRAMAQTLACDPGFYPKMFCSGCRAHFQSREFHWLSGSQRQLGDQST